MSNLKRSLSNKLKATLSKTKKKFVQSSNSSYGNTDLELSSQYSFTDADFPRKPPRPLSHSAHSSHSSHSTHVSISNSSIQKSIRRSYEWQRDHELELENADPIPLPQPAGDHPHNGVVMLPLAPIDESIPPCTTEELTPILPISLTELKQTLQQQELVSQTATSLRSSPKRPQQQPLIISTLSSSTSATLSTSGVPTSIDSPLLDQHIFENGLIKTLSNSSIFPSNVSTRQPSLSFSSISGVPTQMRHTASSISQSESDSIFAKANQIDHFDKSNATIDNDRLADQMALNILDHISEEQTIDELSKFKEEISTSFNTLELKFI